MAEDGKFFWDDYIPKDEKKEKTKARKVLNQGKPCPFMGYYFSCHAYEDDDIIYMCPYVKNENLHECPANIAKALPEE